MLDIFSGPGCVKPWSSTPVTSPAWLLEAALQVSGILCWWNAHGPLHSGENTITGHSSDHFKNAYNLLNLRALKLSPLNKTLIFYCTSRIFCVEFQRIPLKISYPFHSKYLIHTLKDMRALKFKHLFAFFKSNPPPPPTPSPSMCLWVSSTEM